MKNDREARRCCVLMLLLRDSYSCAQVGDWLVRKKLVSRAGNPSNFCLLGSAVLRSLQRDGLVADSVYGNDRWAPRKFALTQKGRELAEKIKTEAKSP